MCLGEICQVIGMEPDGRVRVKGDSREQVVSLMTLETCAEVGDWVVVHSGFALGWLDPSEAADALSLRAAFRTERTLATVAEIVRDPEPAFLDHDPATQADHHHSAPISKDHS